MAMEEKNQQKPSSKLKSVIARTMATTRSRMIVFSVVFALVGTSFVLLSLAATSPQIVTVPASITADCSADVATPLGDWFNSLPDNTTVNMPTNACYRAESSIKILNKTGMIINGNGATLKRTTYNGNNAPKGDYRHIHLGNDTNMQINNLNIVGQHIQQKPLINGYYVAVEGQAGIGMYGCHGVVVNNVTIQHVNGDFVYIDSMGPHDQSTNITIKNSNFNDAGRQGVSVISADSVLVTDTNLQNTGRSSFDLEPGGAKQSSITNVAIVHNIVGPGGSNFISNQGGGGATTNLVVQNNILHRSMTVYINPPLTFRRGPITITGNTTDRGGGGDAPMDIHAVDGGLIANNQIISTSPPRTMIRLIGTTNFQVINNTVTGASATLGDTTGSKNFCVFNNQPANPGDPVCTVLTLSGLVDQQTVLGNAINVQAVSSNDATNLNKVDFYLDGKLVKTDVSTPFCLGNDASSTSCAPYDITQLNNGLHTLLAVLTYNGTSTVSANVTFTKVSQANLKAVLILPQNGTTVHGKVPMVAAASGGTLPYAKVQFFALSQKKNKLKMLGEVPVGYYGAQFTWQTGAIPDGNYTIYAKVFDSAGNNADSPSIGVTVYHR